MIRRSTSHPSRVAASKWGLAMCFVRQCLAIGVRFGACVAATACLRQNAVASASTSTSGVPLADDPMRPVVETDRPSAVFALDGEPFCFAGSNNYYLTYKSHKMVDDVLDTAKRMGLRVMRLWGYLDRGSLDRTTRDVDGPGEKEGVYFQYWDAHEQRPAYNDGVTGLEHLDYVLDAARKRGLKLIVVLTNNWRDFGGMDQYLVWYRRTEHHQFYTDPVVVHAYKDWVAHVIGRKNSITGMPYRDDPTIFAWELANEPRCTNSGEFDHPADCKPSMLDQWVDDLSSYIKSLDPNHLVAAGDEGFFAGGDSSGYDGSEGVDHAALLALNHIDFGTFHLYPESWGHRTSWASQWIEDHIAAARVAGKPTLLEEYGIVAHRDAQGVVTDDSRRRRAYDRWHDVILKRGGNAALFWMLAGLDDEPDGTQGMYPDYDHFGVYSTDAVAVQVKAFAAMMLTGARACLLYRQLVPSGRLPKSPFVSVSPPPSPRAPAERDRPGGALARPELAQASGLGPIRY